MNPIDNCATALDDIIINTELQIDEISIRLNQYIPLGHKFALQNIKKGELIKKYGQIIGITTQDIKMGDWIHTHNLKSYYLEVAKK
jgi:altronate dehydratase